MADELKINSKELERLNKEFERLDSIVKQTHNAYREIKESLQDLRDQQSLVSSITSDLKSPLISSILSLTEGVQIQSKLKEIQEQKIVALEADKDAQLKAIEMSNERLRILGEYKTALQGTESEIQAQQEHIKALNDVSELHNKSKELLYSKLATLRDEIEASPENEKQKLEEEYKNATFEVIRVTEAQENMADQLKEAESILKKMTEKVPDKSLEELNNAIENETNALNTSKTELDSLNKTISKEKQTLELMPFQNTARLLTDINKVLRALIEPVRETQQQLGIAAGQAANLRFNQLVQSITSTAGTILSLGKDAAVSAELIQQAQIAFQREFGGVISSGAAEELASQAREMGVSVSELASARRAFLTTAFGDVSVAIEQQERAIAAFEDKGLTARDAVEFIGSNAELIARSGTRFQDSLIRAAAEAKKIGVDLSKVNQVGDNIIGNFESFLVSMAELGAMGFGFDAVRLAEIAESGDTGALFQELQSQLAMTGKDLQDLRRSEQLALSQAFGMDIAEFQRLAGIEVEGGGERMEDLQKQTNVFLERLVNFFDAIAKPLAVMSAAIAGVISVGQTALLGQIALNTGISAGKDVAGMISKALTTIGILGTGAAGIGIGTAGGTSIAKSMGASGSAGFIGSGIGSIAGGLTGRYIGGLIGQSLIPIPGVGFAIGAALGGMAGGAITGMAFGDDVISRPGYGERTLVTPQGPIALNNEDNVIAYADDMVSREAEGITLLSKGALTQESPEVVNNINVDMSRLERKLDAVVDAFRSTKIQLDGNNVGKVILDNERATRLRAGLLSQRI